MLIQSELNALNNLPCFEGILQLELLTDGMSHTCIKVTTVTQVFFAKKLNKNTAATEVFCALTCAKKGLSPAIIYYDDVWLVTEFIVGLTLAESKLNRSEVITMALALMAKLHQLPIKNTIKSIPRLDITKAINTLFINSAAFNIQQKTLLTNVTKLLTIEIQAHITSSTSDNVVCHGDINFNNILIDNVKKPWLIDFECCHIAPREFDIAMLIAVNNIPIDYISIIINSYIKLVPSYQPNNKLLTYFILYSLFINGLWYLDNIDVLEPDSTLRDLARQQWSTFDHFALQQAINIPKLTSLLN